MINANWTTQVVRAACVLGVPDRLAEGARSLAQLADATGAHAPSLRRLLQAMATLELCAETDDARYAATPLGRLLCEDDPRSLRAWALLVGGPHWARWGELHESVRTGRSHKQRHLGEEGFGDLETDPAGAAMFHQAMVQMTRRVAESVLEVLPVADGACVVDVGGGQGQLLASVLAAHRAARGVLFDLPAGVAGAPDVMRHAGVDDRCDVVHGDFFDGVPAGGDLYLLKSVPHNWDDARCVRILANCRQAMGDASTVVVVERLMPPRAGTGDRAVARSDLNMLVALTGRERTRGEYEALFDAAGLRVAGVQPTRGDFVLVSGA